MTAVIAAGIAVVLTPIAVRVALAVGLVDRPADAELEIHDRPVPILGGPAVVAAALTAAALDGNDAVGTVAWGIGSALAVGLVDDARPLPAWLRLGLLACAGALLAAAGVRVEPFGPLAWVAVPVLAVVCANGINILDGQNGMAGGIGAVAAAGLAAGAGATRGLGLAVAGALVGFLVWNLRGRIFLGNGGAYALGTALAALAALAASANGWRGVLAAAACLALIPFEIIFTLTRRARAGAALFPGDRDHTYDIVARRTGSREKATYVFWALAIISAAVGVAARHAPVAVGAGLLGVMAVAAAWWGRSLMPARAEGSTQSREAGAPA